MSKSNTLYGQIKSLYATFEEEHEKNAAGNKAAGSRARKALNSRTHIDSLCKFKR